MEAVKQKNYSADALLAEFFAQDDLKSLAADAGALLDCPLLVLDDTFHVVAYHRPLGFPIRFFRRLSAAAKSPMKPAPLSAEAKR